MHNPDTPESGMKPRNILVDVCHPAHYHLLKNPMKTLEQSGHRVKWVIRKKDVVINLMHEDGVPHTVLTSAKKGLLNMALELAEHDALVLWHAARFKADLLVGTSVSSAHAALLLPRAKSIVFNEDNADAVKLFSRLSYPFASAIVTPDCLKEDHGHKHVRYPSYQELAYLHPDHFTPDPGIPAHFGIDLNKPYFLLRFVALQASHDGKEQGLSFEAKQTLINRLSELGTVYISSESEIPPEFQAHKLLVPPSLIHHVMAHSAMLVSDSQTMTAEAAVLGVPSVRCNTFVGRLDYLEDLEHTFKLTQGFIPPDEGQAVSTALEMAESSGLGQIYQERRQSMLKQKINLAPWIHSFLESY